MVHKQIDVCLKQCRRPRRFASIVDQIRIAGVQGIAATRPPLLLIVATAVDPSVSQK